MFNLLNFQPFIILHIITSHGIYSTHQFTTEYCNIIWAIHHSAALHPLLITQKRAVRIVTFSKLRAHTNPIFEKLNILTL